MYLCNSEHRVVPEIGSRVPIEYESTWIRLSPETEFRARNPAGRPSPCISSQTLMKATQWRPASAPTLP